MMKKRRRRWKVVRRGSCAVMDESERVETQILNLCTQRISSLSLIPSPTGPSVSQPASPCLYQFPRAGIFFFLLHYRLLPLRSRHAASSAVLLRCGTAPRPFVSRLFGRLQEQDRVLADEHTLVPPSCDTSHDFKKNNRSITTVL